MQSHFQGREVPILCNVSIAIVSISRKDIAGVCCSSFCKLFTSLIPSPIWTDPGTRLVFLHIKMSALKWGVCQKWYGCQGRGWTFISADLHDLALSVFILCVVLFPDVQCHDQKCIAFSYMFEAEFSKNVSCFVPRSCKICRSKFSTWSWPFLILLPA